jgi:maleylacetoacetate isomerase
MVQPSANVSQLVLYSYWRSSASYRVRIALGLKGLPYRYEAVNIVKGEQSSEAFRARAPIGHVPCLEIDGVPYVESVAIIELLEDLYPTPSFCPEAPAQRARMRALCETINSGIQPLQNLVVLNRLKEEERKPWMQHFMARGLFAFEALLAKASSHVTEAGPFCLGAKPTMADIFLVPQMYAARRFEVDLAAFPRARQADEAARALPAFANASPEVQPDAPKP